VNLIGNTGVVIASWNVAATLLVVLHGTHPVQMVSVFWNAFHDGTVVVGDT